MRSERHWSSDSSIGYSGATDERAVVESLPDTRNYICVVVTRVSTSVDFPIAAIFFTSLVSYL